MPPAAVASGLCLCQAWGQSCPVIMDRGSMQGVSVFDPTCRLSPRPGPQANAGAVHVPDVGVYG